MEILLPASLTNLALRSSLVSPHQRTRARLLELKLSIERRQTVMKTNTKKLGGKVAIVTGASKGIGAAIAKHLAAEGAAVVVNYSSSKEGADRVVDEITKQGGKAVAVRANMAKKAEVERLFSEAKKAFGRLDILVNNAGVYEFLPVEIVTEAHLHKYFDVHVLGLL